MWHHTHPLLGVPIGVRYQCGYITFALPGSPYWGGINMATKPLPSPGPHSEESRLPLRKAYLLQFLQRGRINMATYPPPSRGPHKGEIRMWLHHLCLLGVAIVGSNQYGFSSAP